MNLEETVNPDINPGLKESVLNWLETMRVEPYQYRMNEGADSSIFTSCFALFILHLLNALDDLSAKEKKGWTEHIKSYQDRNTGLFIPEYSNGYDEEKLTRQLTCFCLSALNLLDERPKLPLSFMEEYKAPEDVENYLYRIGCHRGVGGTGNKAMFLAIFLTYLIEYQQDDSAKNKLEAWFNWHEKTQNKSTGFWGNSLRNKYYAGFQNAFHQFVIYNYRNRSVPCFTKIVDIVLSLQDENGHFAPIPGGGGCWDYDAADILINLGYKKAYRQPDVKVSLERLLDAILKNQNTDGGFCESRKRVSSLGRVFQAHNLNFIFSGLNPYPCCFRLRKTLSKSRKRNSEILTQWSRTGKKWGQSDLWNTWFRCLTIAEIETTLYGSCDWNFQKFVGLGFFRKPEIF